jgi:hypothetical protein
MKTMMKPFAAAIALAVAAPLAFAAGPGMGMCAKEPNAKAIQTQQEKMEGCMRRLQEAKTPAERQKAMDDHMKQMQAGMGYMRGKHSAGCHGEMMDHMMDHMKQHRSAIGSGG